MMTRKETEKAELATKPPKAELGDNAYNPHNHRCSNGHELVVWHHDPARLAAEVKARNGSQEDFAEAFKRSHMCPVCGTEAHWTVKGHPTYVNDGLRVYQCDGTPDLGPETEDIKRAREMSKMAMLLDALASS